MAKTKIKWDDAIKTALDMLEHADKYAYFYGAKGAELTDYVMNYLWNSEPVYFSRYNEQQKKEIFDYSRGKIGFDCSGFVGKCVDDMTWSRGIWDHCYDKKVDVFQGVAGSIVYRTGHIGIDIGYGFYLNMGRELHSVELGRFKEHIISWEGCGKHYNIDYTGANNR